MSCVLNVQTFSETQSGPRVQAVLKLYDRRFGKDLRSNGNDYVPHTAAREAVFQSFVRQQKMDPFCERLDEYTRNSGTPWWAHHLLGNKDGNAKYEAATWKKCDEYFECETGAYERLKEIQGKTIPRMYAHVRLTGILPGSNVPADLRGPKMAKYFEVKGILLEHIPGYSLKDMDTSPLATSDPLEIKAIIQSAVDRS